MSTNKLFGFGVLALLLVGLLAFGLWKSSDSNSGAAAVQPDPRADGDNQAEPGGLPVQVAGGEERSSVEESSAPSGAVVEEQPEVESEPQTGCALRLQLLDADGGQPLSGFRLEITSPSLRDPDRPLRFEFRSDDDGWIETESTIPRGQLDFRHLPEEGHERYELPWEIRPDNATVMAHVGESEELRLQAARPSVVVKIEARLANESPVIDRQVVLVEGRPGDDGGIDWFLWRYARSNREGIATFCLYGDLTARPFAAQVFKPVGDEVCDALLIAAPIGPGPHRVQTYLGGRIEVCVRDAEDRPISDVEVSCWFTGMPMMFLRADRQTDAGGCASFAPLPAGTYRVDFGSSYPREDTRGAEVVLSRGEVREFVLRIEDQPTARLVVSGRVLEPDGSPAQDVWLGFLRGSEVLERMPTDEDGRFELYSCEPWDWVVVSTAASVFVDPIEPRELRVRAGTTDLVFQKLTRTELAQVDFRLLDATTGTPIPDEVDPAVVIYRKPPEGSPVLGLARFGATDGRCLVDLRPHPELAWRVLAPGYRVQVGDFDGPLPEGEIPVLEVKLESGFERELIVRDSAGGARLVGAVFRDTTGSVFARTDVDGRALLTGDEWPGELTVELDGFEPLTWDARVHWSNWGKQLWLRAQD